MKFLSWFLYVHIVPHHLQVPIIFYLVRDYQNERIKLSLEILTSNKAIETTLHDAKCMRMTVYKFYSLPSEIVCEP